MVDQNLSRWIIFYRICCFLHTATAILGMKKKAIENAKNNKNKQPLLESDEKFWKDLLLVSVWCGIDSKRFQEVFETAMTFSPEQRGVFPLFYKNNDGSSSNNNKNSDKKDNGDDQEDNDDDDKNITPFAEACRKYGTDETIQLIESTIADNSTTIDNTTTTAQSLISAAMDENISLDGVYFLLRREPNVLRSVLHDNIKFEL